MATDVSMKARVFRQLRVDFPDRTLPLRNNGWDRIPLVKHDDPAYLKYRIVKDAFVERFRLWKEDELKRYREVCDKVAKKQAAISYEHFMEVPDKQNWVVLIRWVEFVVEPPKPDADIRSIL